MHIDRVMMTRALRLGQRALGITADNPSVGCVIARGAEVIGVGATAPGGRPHAEIQALAMAGAGAQGATAYVTLEPCAHHGRTGPCAVALAAAGIARAVVCCTDPDPRVNGQGLAILQRAGVVVECGLMAEEARAQLAGFFSRIVRGRPFVILKLAVSADGMLAERPGVRTAITGAAAQAQVHLLRAQCDAILVGMDTVLTDDPALTVRLPGLEARSPRRLVASRNRTIAPGAKLLPADVVELESLLSQAEGKPWWQEINRLLVEGGAGIARVLLDADLVDEVHLFTALLLLGPHGLAAPLAQIERNFIRVRSEPVGADGLTVYARRV